MADLNLKEFVSHFSAVVACVPSRTPKDILKNVKMVVDGKSIHLMAADGEISMRREITLEEHSGMHNVAVLLPASKVLQVLRELSDSKFSFDLAEASEGRVFIQSGLSEFKLSVVIDHEGFPPVSEFSDAEYLRIDGPSLKNMIKKTIFAVDADSTRYALGGLAIEYTIGRLTVASTDSRRLCVIQAPCGHEGSFPSRRVVIPADAMKLVESAIGSEEVFIAIRSNDVSFKAGTTTISAQLVQGRFPDWAKVIPDEEAYVGRVAIPASPMAALCRQAIIATNEESRGVDFKFTKGELIVSSKATDIGSAKVKMIIAYEGEEMTVTVDCRYMLEYLKALGDQTAQWNLISHDDRIMAKCDDWTHVIMPLSRD